MRSCFSSRLILALLLASGPALAAQYEAEIDVENETDLYELNQRGDIADETLDTLVELMRTGVDLNTATRDELYELPNITYAEVDRILEYRSKVTNIDDPADLVRVEILTEKQLLQIAPFLVITPQGGAAPLSGWIRTVGAYTVGDPYAPASYLQFRAKGPVGLSAGLLAVGTRRRLGQLQWDENVITGTGRDQTRGAFTATAPRYGLELPKFFLQWKATARSVILGTYRIGFGQRLTLDNTTRQTPDGIYADDAVQTTIRALSRDCRISTGGDPQYDCNDDEYLTNLYVTPDFRWREPFRGAAGTISDLEVGDSARIGLTGFAGHQTRNVYQYSLYYADRCSDPLRSSDDDAYCGAPPVYLREEDGTRTNSRFRYQTLPAVFDEIIGGGNAKLTLGPGRRVGVTGYYSNPLHRIPGVDFQEFNRYPYGGGFGAVGVDGAFALDRMSLFAEVARSFDNTPGNGGGFGVIQRSVYSLPKNELELTLRYYDRKFANPYSRAFAEPDQLYGQRVRNELGARLRYLGNPLPDFKTRFAIDVWTLPGDSAIANTAGQTNLRTDLRTEFTGWSFFKPGLWIDYRNKGIVPAPNPDELFDPDEQVICYETAGSTGSDGDTLPCDGQYFRVVERAQLVPIRKYLTLTLQAQQKWVSDPRYDTEFRTDMSVFVQASSQPVDSIRLRARTKWLDEGIDNDEIGETSLWSLVDVSYIVPRTAEVRLRYDNYLWLDRRGASLSGLRAGTQTRIPNPEHRLRLELEARF